MTEVVPTDVELFIKAASQIKKTIKDLLKTEKCLKSLSFSIQGEEREFIIYFAWNKDPESVYQSSERIALKEKIKLYMKSLHFVLNPIKSTDAKFVFKKIRERS